MLTAERYPCRLIVDPPQDGAWNMAVDEALLNDAADRGQATLRFYQWREPTLSLGYFQPYAERHAHAASRGAAVVRRLSGGGALIHDRELTYSLCLPAGHPAVRRPAELYGVAHRALIGVLATRNVEARMYCDERCAAASDAEADSSEEPFLCFQRRTGADVVVDLRAADAALEDRVESTVKIVGSAQRRRRQAVLQHGGLLLDRSPLAPELAGLRESLGANLAVGSIVPAWSESIAQSLSLQLTPTSLPDEVRRSALVLATEKYLQPNWTERR